MSILKKKELLKIVLVIYYLEYIYFFSEYILAVENDEKGHTDRDLFFERKRQEALEKT